MSESSREHHEPTPPNKQQRSAVVLMLGTIADTTWRMFVPTLILIPAGFMLDQTFGSWPWFFVAGIVLGFIIAGVLVKAQLKKPL